ncbi:hypothetical protein GE061_006605 [Apolygus lucorum]|uniref:PBZ-type domain-containing protein n=1 Tax=Apolygus lucorum TaxID=248454 RepID=A0A6A4JAN3_APOLU|nr:hypothetical protein GE061_006605 [Apolygus lucorum]
MSDSTPSSPKKRRVTRLRDTCIAGPKCFSKQVHHFQKYDHPHLESLLRELGNTFEIPLDHKARNSPISMETLKEQLGIVKKIQSGDISLSNSPEKKRPTTAEEIERLKQEAEKGYRKRDAESKKAATSKDCTFGEKCYRKHPEHFKEFSHPHLSKMLDIIGDSPIDSKLLATLQGKMSYETLRNQLEIVRKIEGRSYKPRANVEGSSSGGSSSQSGRVQLVVEKPGTSSIKGTLPVTKAMRDKNAAALEKERVVVMDRVKNSITSKLEAAAPYNFFLTTITESKDTHHEKLSVSFIELIDPMLGELDGVLQMNFMVQLGWLLSQFHILGLRQIPMTLLYGEIDMDVPNQLKSFITPRKIKPPSPFGSHHTKLMVFTYKDGGLRVVISTANLVESDWDNRTQGLWISPKCPALPEDSDTLSGESPTRFKMCFTRYLSAYKVPELVPWIKKISRADMSEIRVFFVGSVPGSHAGQGLKQWGLGALSSVLSDNVVVPEKNSYPLILQCSSIGSLGPNPDSYLTGDVLRTFCSGKKEGVVGKPDVKLVYPTFDNIVGSYDGILGGGCLPYSTKTHDKQKWLTSFMCHWKSDRRFRSRAPPHIKTYCRISPDHKKMSYFVLTSANLSKAAWGSYNKSGNLSILSYEAGVVFLPQYFFGEDHFPLQAGAGDRTPVFPLPFDLPLTPYKFNDVPWFFDNLS